MADQDASASAVSSVDGIARIVLVGDVGETTADRLRAEALARLAPPLQQLVVDLHDCRYLEPAAVDLLGEMFGRTADLGAAISVQGASANVSVILAISGLLDLADGSGRDGP